MTTKKIITHSEMLIAQRFKALRIDSGMQAASVARALDMPSSTLRSIEAGKHLPNLIVCGILCAFYDAPVDFILTGTGLNRKLKMPRGAEIMLREIMTPLDLQTPKPTGKSGFLTLKVAQLPQVEPDLKRMMLRSQPKEILAAAQSIEQAAPRDSKPRAFFKIPEAKPTKKPLTKAKKSAKVKPDLKRAGLLDL